MYQQLLGYKVYEKLHLGVREKNKIEHHWSKKRGIFHFTKSYGLPRPVTGILLPLLTSINFVDHFFEARKIPQTEIASRNKSADQSFESSCSCIITI
jgi:hypothetical protein